MIVIGGIVLMAVVFIAACVLAAAVTMLAATLAFTGIVTALSAIWCYFRPRRAPRVLTIDSLRLSSPTPAPIGLWARLTTPDLRDPHGRAPLERMAADFMYGWRGYRDL